MSSTESEAWRPVKGYEGLYEVSDMGRVWSVRRKTPNRDGTFRNAGGRFIGGRVDVAGYPVVDLYKEFDRRVRRIHQLVAEAFLPEPQEGQIVRHLDDVKTNNTVSNLRWGSFSENSYDMVRNGGHWGKNKTSCPQGHLLEGPNLIPSLLRRGYRGCLSCKRARTNIARDGGVFDPERADRTYEKLMREGK